MIARPIWNSDACERAMIQSTTLTANVIAIPDLSSDQRDEMLDLMNRYYEGVDREYFHADLDEKHWVIHIVDRVTGHLCGFSTQMMLDADVAGRPIRALFSGDTIIDHQHWTHNPLAQVWGRLVLTLIDDNPGAEMYWFLISKGYRTYRFLPVFFRDFYPRFDESTPTSLIQVIDAFGESKFPADYDANGGIIRANRQGYHLRQGVSDITESRLRDPHIHFFADKNPRHAQGDELCCVAPLTRENFTRAAYRVIGANAELTTVLP
jgi:hypothetical protein